MDKNRKVDCDWLQLSTNHRPPFAIKKSDDRSFHSRDFYRQGFDFRGGVEGHVPREKKIIVTEFPENEPGYLLSPVMGRGEGEKVRVSFFNFMTSQCHKVEAFLLPGDFDVTGVERLPNRFLVVRGKRSAWQQSGASVPVNSSFDQFKVSSRFFFLRKNILEEIFSFFLTASLKILKA